MLGEYGTSASDVKAEFIWMSPEVAANDNSPFGGDGLGGYMPLSVAVPTFTDPARLLWVHANHMGVPAVFTDATGTAIPMPTGYSAPGFPGQSRTLADLYYNRYRDYDPTIGRYIQADPIGLAGGASPYSYALNSPLRYSDPSGQFAAALAGCFNPLGAVVCTVAGGVALYATYKLATLCEEAVVAAFGGGGIVLEKRSEQNGRYGGGIGSNYPGDETGDPCKQEVDDARKKCLGKGMYGPKLGKCMNGYITRRCGGNRPDYEHDPKAPKMSRPKNWKSDDAG